jgi:hypothetical protein
MNYQRRVKSVSAIVTPGRHRVRARPCLRHGPLVPPLCSSQYHEGRRTLRSPLLACSIYRIEHRSFPLDLASRKDHGANRSLFGTLPDSFNNHCHERPRAGRRSGIELPPRSLSLPNDVSRSSPRRARSARVDAGLAGSAAAARPGRKFEVGELARLSCRREGSQRPARDLSRQVRPGKPLYTRASFINGPTHQT